MPDLEPRKDLWALHRKTGFHIGKQDFTEAIDSETLLGSKGRAAALLMVASALWVALPSVGAGDDGFIASSFPLQSQQEEIGNKILLHLEKALLILTHLPYPLLSAPKKRAEQSQGGLC